MSKNSNFQQGSNKLAAYVHCRQWDWLGNSNGSTSRLLDNNLIEKIWTTKTVEVIFNLDN